MARYIIQEPLRTVREKPVRAAMAALLLLTTAIYVCTDHTRIPVAEIGEETTPIIDLTDQINSQYDPIEQVSVDDSESPATATRVEGRDRFQDSRVVTAIAELSDDEKTYQTRVQPVSGQATRSGRAQKPVWLLGKLIED